MVVVCAILPISLLLLPSADCFFGGGCKFRVADAIIAAAVLPICGDGSIVAVIVVIIQHCCYVWTMMVTA